MRDEPGIGAFVVTLRLDAGWGAGPRMLDSAEIAQLRATRKVIGDRARAVFELRTAMPPPETHVAPG